MNKVNKDEKDIYTNNNSNYNIKNESEILSTIKKQF